MAPRKGPADPLNAKKETLAAVLLADSFTQVLHIAMHRGASNALSVLCKVPCMRSTSSPSRWSGPRCCCPW